MLEALFAREGLPEWDLPPDLRETYGGAFGLPDEAIVANLVSSIDGVAAIPGVDRSSALISGSDRGDRFIMGFLRAAADVVLIGAGTLRAHPRSLWTSEQAYPDGTPSFRQFRDTRKRPAEPALAVVTASGRIDPAHPALQREAVIITTKKGAEAFNGDTETVVLGEGDDLDTSAVVDALRARGHRLILTEGGPTLLGDLLRSGLVDELFLTVSPRVAGRSAKDERLGLVEGAEFLPKTLKAADLLSARRHDSHLFLRYAMRAPSPA